VPPWLATRMAALGRIVAEAIVHEYGRDELLRRLAHPFWFQSFGAVMGMDWHSSGITTSVVGALKRGLAPIEKEIGLTICGGRGRHSRRTPTELVAVGERTGLDGEALAKASRLVAKVDSAAVQDRFELYLHSFMIADDGHWVVVQQGMNADRRQARRYHWLSEQLESFVNEPHTGIDGPPQGEIVNLTDHRAARARAAEVELACGDPERVVGWLRRDLPLAFERAPAPVLREAAAPALMTTPHLQMPAHHDVRPSDVVLRRMHAALAAAADRGPRDFAELLLVPGVGARTIEALALVAEVVHGTPCRFSDPARFSLAHGGKDGHPFPVPLTVYDETIRVLRGAVTRAKLGREESLQAIRRLDRQARLLEGVADGAPFETLVARERTHSADYGGRTVFGPADAAAGGNTQPAAGGNTQPAGAHHPRAATGAHAARAQETTPTVTARRKRTRDPVPPRSAPRSRRTRRGPQLELF